MNRERTNLAVLKLIACIDSCQTAEHVAGCKRMLQYISYYNVRQATLTYLFMAYRKKHKEVHYG